MTAEIYTSDIINALQKRLMYPQETNTAQKNLIKQTTEHVVINQCFDTRNMVHSELDKMWGWFTGISNIASSVLGIFIIAK